MASGLFGVLVLVLCAVFTPCLSYDDTDCMSYTDMSYSYHAKQYCSGRQYCCGTCHNRYCCRDSFWRLTEDKQQECVDRFGGTYSTLSVTMGVCSVIVFVAVIVFCCVCPCCCLYKMCRKPQPVIATTTHTTVVTSTPQHYPQQPTAVPGHQSYQSAQYPPYQPVPTQPGYGPQPMPSTAYMGQPFVAGPPPTYQEATGPGYPAQPMPYSQAAFSPGQPPYPLQPPAKSGANAPPAPTDFLTQPAFNPNYVAP